MKLRNLPLFFFIATLSLGAEAQQKLSFSAGISSFAEIQKASYYDGFESELNFAGLQFNGAANFNDNTQAQLSFYNAKEEDLSQIKVSGTSVKLNLGKGFQNKGFKAYGSLGFFNETLENTSTNFKDKVNGLEFGGAIGYNFEIVALDWGFTIRSTSGYEKDNIFGSDADVTVTTGFLALSANF